MDAANVDIDPKAYHIEDPNIVGRIVFSMLPCISY